MNSRINPVPDALLTVLACPRCQAPLTPAANGSALDCPQHGVYPVIGGIPSFARDYDPAFEAHWQDNATGGLAEAKLIEARDFLSPLIADPRLDGATVLDAGCGEGAHVAVLSALRAASPRLGVALDIAMSGVRDARRQASTAWCGVHGDMSALPFAAASFDAVFSFGVLHLTPSPRASLAELARVLKPGGLCGLWVFDAGPLLGTGLRVLRALARAAGPRGARLLADLIVPFYGLLPTRSGLTVGNSSWRQTREVLLSNLTPPHMHYLDRATLTDWCTSLGLDVLSIPDPRPLTVWARKRSPA